MSMVSGGDESDSVHYSAMPPPVAEVPPPVGQAPVDQQTISNRFTALYQWAPEVCQEVLPATARTYNIVHAAAASLQGEEESQVVQDVQAQVLGLSLVGMKLEVRLPGLREAWHHVIYFVTGAVSVPLRLMQARDPQAHSLDVAAWRLPIVLGSSISPNWFELGQQAIYSRVRAEVVKRVTMCRRQAARRASAL